ncbi:MAG: insulinase family protein [Leptospirales bacterium]|nr:insulinase family protein [Leptospirales bacterium]
MKLLLRRCLAVLLLALFFSPASSAAAEDDSLQSVFRLLEARIRRVQYPNGLRLIMMKQDYAPTVACYLKVRAGSADEDDASSGIAHMLEHMLFKGTHLVGTRDWQREQKYLEVGVSFANRLDDWRRRALAAQGRGDDAAYREAQTQIVIWRRRLAMINGMARQFILPEEDSQLYGQNGSRGYNAYTTADLTNYQVQLPANRLEVWARLESDRMQNSTLRDFYVERTVVTEERRMRVENVGARALLEKFLIEAYGPEHPYARPVIGPMASIQFLNYNQAMKFYRSHYAPNNSVIALVGDLDFDRTSALVGRYFSGIARKPTPAPPREPPVQRRALRVELRKEGSPEYMLGWFKPPLPDPDHLNLEVLSAILSGGQDSRLYQRLVVQDELAADVGVWTDYPGERYTNLFMIDVTPAPGADYERIQAAILDELQRVVRDGIRSEELEKVRSSMRAAFLYKLRNIDDLADTLSYYEILTGDYHTLFDFYGRIDSLSVADIQSAAARYLRADQAMSARLLPPESSQSQPASEEEAP